MCGFAYPRDKQRNDRILLQRSCGDQHVSAFVLFPAAKVNWWLRCRGCLTEDVNHINLTLLFPISATEGDKI